nr:collagen alpha-1(III) chain-like [Camelus dromedarius]
MAIFRTNSKETLQGSRAGHCSLQPPLPKPVFGEVPGARFPNSQGREVILLVGDEGGPAAEPDVAQTAVPVVAEGLQRPSLSTWEGGSGESSTPSHNAPARGCGPVRRPGSRTGWVPGRLLQLRGGCPGRGSEEPGLRGAGVRGLAALRRKPGLGLEAAGSSPTGRPRVRRKCSMTSPTSAPPGGSRGARDGSPGADGVAPEGWRTSAPGRPGGCGNSRSGLCIHSGRPRGMSGMGACRRGFLLRWMRPLGDSGHASPLLLLAVGTELTLVIFCHSLSQIPTTFYLQPYFSVE